MSYTNPEELFDVDNSKKCSDMDDGDKMSIAVFAELALGLNKYMHYFLKEYLDAFQNVGIHNTMTMQQVQNHVLNGAINIQNKLEQAGCLNAEYLEFFVSNGGGKTITKEDYNKQIQMKKDKK